MGRRGGVERRGGERRRGGGRGRRGGRGEVRQYDVFQLVRSLVSFNALVLLSLSAETVILWNSLSHLFPCFGKPLPQHSLKN